MISNEEKQNIKHNIDIITHLLKDYTTLKVKNIVEISDLNIC